MISIPFTSNNKLTRWSSRHPVIKSTESITKAAGRPDPTDNRQSGAVVPCWDFYFCQFCYSCPWKFSGLPFKKCFCCIHFEANRAIKGIGLFFFFLSLYLVVVTAPQADLGKGMSVARECRRFSCRSIIPYSKPVRLFHDKPVRMILMASFLSCTADCWFPLDLDMLSFWFSIEGLFINPILARANSHPRKCKSIFFSPSFCSVCYCPCNDTVSPLGGHYRFYYSLYIRERS